MEESLSSVAEADERESLPPSAQYIPPGLGLLPRPKNVANSLLPMIPLPDFVGAVPQQEPYTEMPKRRYPEINGELTWIGDAFQYNVVYQKYPDYSYEKLESESWNVWVCDLSKLQGEKPDPKISEMVVEPFYTPVDDSDRTLVFESRFESGNLSMAAKVSDCEYNLLLQNDINTTGYTQWFFFRVGNTTKDRTVKFNILNLYKSNSLFGSGMRVIVYSTAEQKISGVGWHRAGSQFSYQRNGHTKKPNGNQSCYTFSWSYKFKYEQDQVYFAYSYPYTYSDLDQFLEEVNKKLVKRTLLTKTLVGNRVDLLTITEEHPDPTFKKGFIVVAARVHPGQTVSSFVAKGLISFLTSDSPVARRLRQTFIFKVVPMLNPDGVIHGNYRANISGADLNRKWGESKPWHHPQIHHMRKMILKCEEQSVVHLFCDLHGHSIKKSAFMYGNHNSSRPFEGKEFPFILGKLCRSFLFKNCSFLSSDVREGSGRSTLARQLSSPNVYTLESSFCGPENESVHFTIKHLEEIGRSFCEALDIYFQSYIRDHLIDAAKKGKYSFESDNEKSTMAERQSICQELYKNKMLLTERINSENSQGSEEEVEEENIVTETAVKKFLLRSTGKSYSPKRIRDVPLTQTVKSSATFIIHKSPIKKERAESRKKITGPSLNDFLTIEPEKQLEKPQPVRQRTTKTARPVRRQSMKSLATPGKVVNLEFSQRKKETPQRVRRSVGDRSRIQCSSQAKYEFLLGLDNNPQGNCINNFVSSIPRKTSAQRSHLPDMEMLRRPIEHPKLVAINEVAKRTYQERVDCCLQKPSPIKRTKEPEADYNIFRSVLESLRKR